MIATSTARHRVVVIGSGFGGLIAAKKLRRADADVTLISRTTHHLFQPLLYQVATGILSEGEIAPATREILHRQRNVRVVLGDVEDIDLSERTVTSYVGTERTVTPYDSLIVAAGAQTSYFGQDRFETHAPGLKSIDDALELRGRILSAFEFAELAQDEDDVRDWLTFVVVGAGATGVEMAGQIAELAHRTLDHDYRSINSRNARIVLVDAADAVLGNFGTRLAAGAADQLKRLGIEVWLGEKVVDVDDRAITVEDTSGNRTRITSRTVVWAAGVRASGLDGDAGPSVGRGARPRRPRQGAAGLHAARPPRGLRHRRHDVAQRLPRRRAGGDAAGCLCRQGDPSPAARPGAAEALLLLRQGQHGDDLAVQGRRQRRPAPLRRLHRLAAVAGDPPAVPGRLQEPGHDGRPLDGELPRPRAARSAR